MGSICSRSKHFNTAAFEAARIRVLAGKGKALVIVHPLFSESFSSDESIERTAPYLFRQIMGKDYDQYMSRLGRAIKSTSMLPIVLAEKNSYEKARSWLNGMGSDKHIFMAGTISKDPTPEFSFDTVLSPWSILAEALKELGVSKVFLAGELAYSNNSGNTGCVFFARQYLSPYFPVKVLSRLTFPGIY